MESSRLTRVGVALAAVAAATALLFPFEPPSWAWVVLVLVACLVVAGAALAPVAEARIVVGDPKYATRPMRPLKGRDDDPLRPGASHASSGTITATTAAQSLSACAPRREPEPDDEISAGEYGRFAYLPIANEGDADSPPVAPYLDFWTVVGEPLLSDVHARWAGRPYPDFVVVPEKDRSRVMQHGTGEWFLIDTVFVRVGETRCQVYDHALELPPIDDREFRMRLRLRYGHHHDHYDYVVRVENGRPNLEQVPEG